MSREYVSLERLRAGILSYILAIAILISAGLSALTLFVYYDRAEYKLYEKRKRLLHNLPTAEQIARGNCKEFEYGEVYYYDLFDEARDSISILKTLWGLFDRFHVYSFSGKEYYDHVFMAAYAPSQEGHSAIYVWDDGRPISVSGDTKVTGVSYLPLAGVQSAYVNRIGYKNTELIYGERKRSEKEFPEASVKDALDQLRSLDGEVLEGLVDTTHSFRSSPLLFETSDIEVFAHLKGNIILKASSQITFEAEAYAEDIVAVAPKIVFKSGFKGSGQFFATDTMIVEKEVTLKYPTVLACYDQNDPVLIQLEETAEVNGWMLMDGGNDGFRRRQVRIEDAAKFRGMIYCNGMLETYGEITGNATVKRFLVNAPSAVYENYLFNAQINADDLPAEFLMPSQWFYTDTVKVLKYLY